MLNSLRLNDRQLEAVKLVEGPVLVVAGAGSGKTKVVTSKIAYLINEHGYNPYDILAVTFTNKAAKEMKERTEKLLNKNVNGMWIGTFHSICVRILRRFFNNNFSIYDRDDSKKILKKVKKSLNIPEKVYSDAELLSFISKYKTTYIERHPYLEEKIRICEAYQKTLLNNNALDFDDLIIKAIDVLESNEEALDYYTNKFKYVFVDEYQDINDLQFKLIKLLISKHNNITVVGDENQSIYAFRGADVENIRKFNNVFPDARVVKLEQNYRSTQYILNIANRLIEKNPQTFSTELFTEISDGEEVQYFIVDDSNSEAEYIAEEIFSLVRDGYNYGDISILYRTNAQSLDFEKCFIKKGINYQLIGGYKFFERKEIKDLLSYLKFIDNPFDEIAFARLVSSPKRGIGDKTLERIFSTKDVLNISILQALDSFENSNISEIREKFKLLNVLRDNISLSEFLIKVIEEFEFASQFENDPSESGRLENIDEFISFVKKYEDEVENASLNDLLMEIGLLSDIDNIEDSDAVTMMTIHQAKGLEFPVCFVVGLEEGLFPSYRSFDTAEAIEEERRLCYVALTRAKKRLYLCSANQRMFRGMLQANKPSRFIEDMDELFVKKDKSIRSSYRSSSSSFSNNIDVGYIKKNISDYERVSSKPTESFALMDRVKHNKFGNGSIIGIDGNVANILFDNVGMKKLDLTVAKLEKIDE